MSQPVCDCLRSPAAGVVLRLQIRDAFHIKKKKKKSAGAWWDSEGGSRMGAPCPGARSNWDGCGVWEQLGEQQGG